MDSLVEAIHLSSSLDPIESQQANQFLYNVLQDPTSILLWIDLIESSMEKQITDLSVISLSNCIKQNWEYYSEADLNMYLLKIIKFINEWDDSFGINTLLDTLEFYIKSMEEIPGEILFFFNDHFKNDPIPSALNIKIGCKFSKIINKIYQNEDLIQIIFRITEDAFKFLLEMKNNEIISYSMKFLAKHSQMFGDKENSRISKHIITKLCDLSFQFEISYYNIFWQSVQKFVRNEGFKGELSEQFYKKLFLILKQSPNDQNNILEPLIYALISLNITQFIKPTLHIILRYGTIIIKNENQIPYSVSNMVNIASILYMNGKEEFFNIAFNTFLELFSNQDAPIQLKISVASGFIGLIYPSVVCLDEHIIQQLFQIIENYIASEDILLIKSALVIGNCLLHAQKENNTVSFVKDLVELFKQLFFLDDQMIQFQIGEFLYNANLMFDLGFLNEYIWDNRLNFPASVFPNYLVISLMKTSEIQQEQIEYIYNFYVSNINNDIDFTQLCYTLIIILHSQPEIEIDTMPISIYINDLIDNYQGSNIKYFLLFTDFLVYPQFIEVFIDLYIKLVNMMDTIEEKDHSKIMAVISKILAYIPYIKTDDCKFAEICEKLLEKTKLIINSDFIKPINLLVIHDLISIVDASYLNMVIELLTGILEKFNTDPLCELAIQNINYMLTHRIHDLNDYIINTMVNVVTSYYQCKYDIFYINQDKYIVEYSSFEAYANLVSSMIKNRLVTSQLDEIKEFFIANINNEYTILQNKLISLKPLSTILTIIDENQIGYVQQFFEIITSLAQLGFEKNLTIPITFHYYKLLCSQVFVKELLIPLLPLIKNYYTVEIEKNEVDSDSILLNNLYIIFLRFSSVMPGLIEENVINTAFVHLYSHYVPDGFKSISNELIFYSNHHELSFAQINMAVYYLETVYRMEYEYIMRHVDFKVQIQNQINYFNEKVGQANNNIP